MCVLCACNKQPDARPNILMIITDDQGYGDLSIHGNPHVATPNMDKIGQDGVRFDRFYVSTVCAPSRASVLTGRYHLRTGTHGVTRNQEAMRPEEVTLAEALKGAGYQTACIGKWHNGIQYPYTPLGQGFDYFFGFTGGHINDYFDATLLRGTTSEQTQGYITDVLTDDAIEYIKGRGQEPFFCYLAYNAPHGPWQVPDAYYDRFREKGFNEVVSSIWGMVENLDDNIGRLIECLGEEGISENTLVVFLTDNGATRTEGIYNADMRGGKTSVHEGGSRVPLFIHWQEAGWEPHLVDQLTAHIDLYPTLLDLCDVDLPPGPELDGISLRPLIEEEHPVWEERVIFTQNPIDETNIYPAAVRIPEYRLVKKIPGSQAGSNAVNRDLAAFDWELYNMIQDPGETENLAAENQALVQELSAKYLQWFESATSVALERFPLPVGYVEQNPVLLFAPQSEYTAPVRYFTGRGAANDWLTGWTGKEGKIWFDIDVVRKGSYRLEIAYACPSGNEGSKIRVSSGDAFLEAIVPVAPVVPVPLQDRAPGYKSRVWAKLDLGEMELKEGKQKLLFEALEIPGSEVLDFKHVALEYIE